MMLTEAEGARTDPTEGEESKAMLDESNDENQAPLWDQRRKKKGSGKHQASSIQAREKALYSLNADD